MMYRSLFLVFTALSISSMNAQGYTQTKALMSASRMITELKSHGYSDICDRNPNGYFNAVATIVRKEVKFRNSPLTVMGKGNLSSPFVFCTRFTVVK